VASYLKVFRAIFDNAGHSAHYKMMMGDAYVEAPEAALIVKNSEIPKSSATEFATAVASYHFPELAILYPLACFMAIYGYIYGYAAH
jgi:hypothetical protein